MKESSQKDLKLVSELGVGPITEEQIRKSENPE